MRTIKFRVWDNELRKYRSEKDGDYSLGVLSGMVRGIYGEKFPQMEVEQFTGLLDKNGKEIYEGDILNDQIVVTWRKDLASFALMKEGWAYDHYFGEAVDAGNTEIIGNIHENPELLKSE